MSSCGICLDLLKCPVSLLCGHTFCEECVVQIVHSVRPFKTTHLCPTCRQEFSIVNMNPAFVPSHLRPYVSPCVRRLYLDQPQQTASPPSSTPSRTPELIHLEAQNSALRLSCERWKRQAEVHDAAKFEVLAFAQATKDYANHLRRENEELQRKLSQALADRASSSTSQLYSTMPSPFLNSYEPQSLSSMSPQSSPLLSPLSPSSGSSPSSSSSPSFRLARPDIHASSTLSSSTSTSVPPHCPTHPTDVVVGATSLKRKRRNSAPEAPISTSSPSSRPSSTTSSSSCCSSCCQTVGHRIKRVCQQATRSS